MSVTSRKYPKDKDKHIGIEIEFLSTMSEKDIVKTLTKSKNAKLYHLHHDGSVNDNVPTRPREYCGSAACMQSRNVYVSENRFIVCAWCYSTIREIKAEDKPKRNGHELSVLFKEKDILSIMKVLAKDLKAIGAEVNKTCGLHVHLDMRTRSSFQAYVNLIEKQTLLFSMVDKSRKHNNYCKRSSKNYYDSSHHNAINGADAFEEHQTLEVRMHHGTVDVREIYKWTKLLISIVDAKKTSVFLSKYIKEKSSKAA